MGMEIKGPAQAPKALTTQGPGQAQKSSGPTGAQARANAERAFDQTFFSGIAQAGAPSIEGLLGATVQADAVGVGAVKEQIIGMFGALKSEFLKEKPAGRTADAFENEAVLQLAESLTGKDLAETTRGLMTTLTTEGAIISRDSKQALDKLNDAFWSKKLETLSDTGHLQAMPAFAHFTKGPGARDLERLRPAFEATMKAIYASVRKPAAAAAPSTTYAPGAAPASGNAPSEGAQKQTQSGTTSSNTPTPSSEVFELPKDFADKITGVLLKPNSPWFEGDIDALIQIVFMQCAKDAETDLRDMLKEMQQKMKLKQVKRDLLYRMKDDQANIKKEAQKQLDQLKADGRVGADVTLEDYMAQCQITFTPGTVNEQTLDVSYNAPTVAPPDPLPNGWTGADPVGEAQQAVTTAENEQKCNEMAKQGQIDKACADIDANPNLTDQQKAEQKCNAVQQINAEWDPKIQASKDKVADAQDALNAAMNPPEPPPTPPDQLSFAQFGTEIDKVKDELDSLSAQGEMDQMRMQIYMDRRAKAFEACSNAIKKASDTLGAIIKNMT